MNKFREFVFRVVRFIVYILPSSKIKDLLMWPITSRLLGKNYSKVIKLKSNFFMQTYLGDQLGRMMLFYGDKCEYFWEPTTVRIMEKLISRAQNVLLAGSHVGLLVLYARKAMHSHNSTIHTFEPEEKLYQISKCNFDINKNLGKIILNNEALSNSPHNAYIISDTLRSHVVEESAAGAKVIQLNTIDTYISQHGIEFFDFILLDVEGLEYEVLQGADNLLTNHPPLDIIFEVSPRMLGDIKKSDKVFNFLREKGYSFYIINDDYSFKKINKQSREKEIFIYDQHFIEFKDRNYFNVYATHRSVEELVSLGINL